MKGVKTVDEFISTHPEWSNELVKLRSILESTELEETIKWGAPTYCLGNKNIVGLGAFKSYVGLWFHQGVFLSDPKKVLMNAQEGTTKALRQWRFNSDQEMDEKLILKYIKEAIQNQKDGKELKPQKKELVIPMELQEALKADNALKKEFDNFSHSHKREYAEYIAEAKRPETKQKRLDKIIPMIKENIGLNDKYKK